jgi:glycosyltransferase involved in cell wall biosynthesis
MSAPTLSVSAVLLSYNCEEFISEALWSVLHQDYHSLNVLVSDDASEDETVRVIEGDLAHYEGPHTVSFKRRSQNSGSKSAHLNAILPNLTDNVVVLFDGDDISTRRRVSRLVEAFRHNKETRAVYSAMSKIDRSGRPMRSSPVPHPPAGSDSATWFAKVDSYAAGGTLAIHRSVVDCFGALDPEINEDIVLPFRASLLGRVEFVDEPLVTVRRHAASFTASVDRFKSMADYRTRIEAGIEKAKQKAALRLTDIAAAQELWPARAEELEALRHVVGESISQVELTRKLVSRSRRERVKALAKLIRARAYPEELAQHLCLVMAPSLYLRYKRYRVKRNIN